MQECSWKTDYGIECLTCGFQRSFVLLLEGNIFESLKMFPALIPFLLTIIVLVLHLIYKLKNGAKIITILFSITAILIVANYLLKLYNGTVYCCS